MAHLKMNRVMQNESLGFWEQVFNWIKDNTIALGAIGLGWKAIDKGFKYLSDGRVDEIRKIVNEELANEIRPAIKNLTESIDDLKQSIWSLKK